MRPPTRAREDVTMRARAHPSAYGDRGRIISCHVTLDYSLFIRGGHLQCGRQLGPEVGRRRRGHLRSYSGVDHWPTFARKARHRLCNMGAKWIYSKIYKNWKYLKNKHSNRGSTINQIVLHNKRRYLKNTRHDATVAVNCCNKTAASR